MKVHKSIVDSRRNRIFETLKENRTMTVKELSDQMNVSELTIRRDLDYLENSQLIERHYGGATIKDRKNILDTMDETSYLVNALARRAAEFVNDGDTVFINTSSTALLTLKFIKNKRITVITNNGKAIHIDKDPSISVVLSGGELRIPKDAMVGEFALNNLSLVTASISILGCSGITAESGITTAVLQEVPINELMLKRVIGQKVIVADHTKIGHNNSFVSGSIDKIDVLITDIYADKECLEKIRSRGVRVIQVNPDR